jgi:hypothetical protein
MQILILTRQLFHWKDVIMQLWQLSKISRYHVREPCLSCIIQNSVFPRFKFGNLCFAFGTKTNVGGTNMAYNWPEVNRNVLQIYLTSDVLSLCSSQPACEKIKPNQYGERFAKIGKTAWNVAVWRQGTASLGPTDAIRKHPWPEKTMVTKKTSISKSS